MLFIVLIVGFAIGFGLAHMLPFIHNLTTAWQTGYDEAIKCGRVLARNDALDEIMVEYGEDLSRYKRVSNVVE